MTFGAVNRPVSLAIGDVDGVNGPDLAVANWWGNDVSVLLNLCEADACPWDLDGDCVVGITDFLELLAHWGPCR